MWQKVDFMGVSLWGWVVPADLWDALAKTPSPGPDFVLANVSDDGPNRWLRLS